MAAKYVGQIGTFDPSKESVDQYSERLDMFFLANDIKEDKTDLRKALFLSEVGVEIYNVMTDLVSPAKPKDKSLQDLITAIKNHFNPVPLEMSETTKFWRRLQKPDESVAEYSRALRQMAVHCNFGNFLERALRDRFCTGLNTRNSHVMKKFGNMKAEDVTFAKAIQIASTMEMVEREFVQDSQEASVNRISHSLSNTSVSVGSDHQITEKGKHYGNKRFPKSNSKDSKSCWRCNGKHPAHACRFKNEKCYVCQKFGHISVTCKEGQRVRAIAEDDKCSDDSEDMYGSDEDNEDESLGVYRVYAINSSKRADFKIPVQIEDIALDMYLDTAADVSLIPEDVYQEKLRHIPVRQSNITLRAYNDEKIPVKGILKVRVKYEKQEHTLPLIVTKGGGKPPLFGKQWLEKINLDWKKVFCMKSTLSVPALLDKHKELFTEGYGNIVGYKAHIQVQEGARPVYFKPRLLVSLCMVEPYALKSAVESELDRLEKNRIIEKIEQSDWAAPIVVVPKADKSVRICGDYKVTVNQAVNLEQYPLPTVQDLFAALAGGKKFSKLDLSHAYAQLDLDEESKQYLCINTHKGLYKYRKLAYGVKSAPMIFQSVMDKILQGISHCLCFQDDILITAADDNTHLDVLATVLDRLEKHGIKIKKSKCVFLHDSVEYLGHRIDKNGLHPTDDKVQAIKNAPPPRNTTELKAFLGLINYYGPFMKDLSSHLAPLYKLLQKGQQWAWSQRCQETFEKCKIQLTSESILTHYDNDRPLQLACDASPYGVGAVISHIIDGKEKPIAFASRTLTKSEQNYAQITKEALAIVFGVKKFHQYLYGRKFSLVTDHKPLLAILGPKAPVPTLAAARMQRWALILSAYDYDIEYRRSEENANADAMSRLPHESSAIGSDSGVFLCSMIDDLPVNAKIIAEATRKDPTLSRVLGYTLHGWPRVNPHEQLKPYHLRRTELSTEDGCVLWGSRVIIPKAYQER